MKLIPEAERDFLESSWAVDLDHSAASATGLDLTGEPAEVAERVYGFVRDQIRHSMDAGDSVVTLRASEVLAEQTGLCFAKSHLAVALLRLAGVPAGFCYQRLRDGDELVLHGLFAVQLEGTWHRLDARGNKPGVRAEFDLAHERLAFLPDPDLGEADLPQLLAQPAPAVIRALQSAPNLRSVELPASLS